MMSDEPYTFDDYEIAARAAANNGDLSVRIIFSSSTKTGYIDTIIKADDIRPSYEGLWGKYFLPACQSGIGFLEQES